MKEIEKENLKKLNILEIFCYLGSAVICLGIFIFTRQHWGSSEIATKLLVIFGSAAIAYYAGLICNQYAKTSVLDGVFFLIFLVVTPLGLVIVFNHAGFDVSRNDIQSLMSSIVLIGSLLSFFAFRKNIFIIFSIIYGSWLFFHLTSWMLENHHAPHLFSYNCLIAGLIYMLLGYAFSRGTRSILSGFLYFFGALGFLSAALFLGGLDSDQSNLFWQSIYPILVLGIIFLSVPLKSKSFLIFGVLFLTAYLLEITSQYFIRSLGWPFMLIIIGMIVIGISYLLFFLKRKYY